MRSIVLLLIVSACFGGDAASYTAPNPGLAAAMAKADTLRAQADRLEVEAFAVWMRASPPPVVVVPVVPKDPRPSEFNAARDAVKENQRRDRLRELIKDAEWAELNGAYQNVASRVRRFFQDAK